MGVADRKPLSREAAGRLTDDEDEDVLSYDKTSKSARTSMSSQPGSSSCNEERVLAETSSNVTICKRGRKTPERVAGGSISRSPEQKRSKDASSPLAAVQSSDSSDAEAPQLRLALLHLPWTCANGSATVCTSASVQHVITVWTYPADAPMPTGVHLFCFSPELPLNTPDAYSFTLTDGNGDAVHALCSRLPHHALRAATGCAASALVELSARPIRNVRQTETALREAQVLYLSGDFDSFQSSIRRFVKLRADMRAEMSCASEHSPYTRISSNMFAEAFCNFDGLVARNREAVHEARGKGGTPVSLLDILRRKLAPEDVGSEVSEKSSHSRYSAQSAVSVSSPLRASHETQSAVKALVPAVLAILLERRLILHCEDVRLLQSTAELISSLVHPLSPAPTHIPFLPRGLLEAETFLNDAPQPFVVGLLSPYFREIVPVLDLESGGGIVIVDLNSGAFFVPNDLQRMMKKVEEVSELLRGVEDAGKDAAKVRSAFLSFVEIIISTHDGGPLRRSVHEAERRLGGTIETLSRFTAFAREEMSTESLTSERLFALRSEFLQVEKHE